MRTTVAALGGVLIVGLLAAGCSRDIMYGPRGEVVKMKSPDRTMKVKVKGETVQIEGAKGIGGRSRVAPLPVETERDVGIRGVPVPPPAGHIVPAPAAPVESRTVTEETTVVR
ncbi:MAG: hypothetical protein PHN82_10395 [bacterium]|nr:hypothetical protein [bacterium]